MIRVRGLLALAPGASWRSCCDLDVALGSGVLLVSLAGVVPASVRAVSTCRTLPAG